MHSAALCALCCCSASAAAPQDLAARGVSLVYSRGGAGLQQQLLSQLLGVLQGVGSGTAAAGSKLAPETKVFEEGQLGNTPGEGPRPTLSAWVFQCILHVSKAHQL